MEVQKILDEIEKLKSRQHKVCEEAGELDYIATKMLLRDKRIK